MKRNQMLLGGGWPMSAAPAVIIVIGALCWMTLGWSDSGSGANASVPEPKELAVAGRMVTGGGLSLPGFNLLPGGVLEWPNKLRIGHGGGEGFGLPPVNGLIRAQPGGNIVLEPQGDYMRCAIDLFPPRGKLQDFDAIAELTLHRFHPTPTDQEMLSLSALATAQDCYALVVEAHGRGKLKPFRFLTVQGGLNPGEKLFVAEPMRITEAGTAEFGRTRRGGPLERPVDSITLEQPEPTATGSYNSDYLKWVGKGRSGRTTYEANWRANVRVESPRGRSAFVLQSGIDDGPYANKLEVTARGDLELPTAGGAVILRSPNGKRWRITVDNSGQLRVGPAS